MHMRPSARGHMWVPVPELISPVVLQKLEPSAMHSTVWWTSSQK